MHRVRLYVLGVVRDQLGREPEPVESLGHSARGQRAGRLEGHEMSKRGPSPAAVQAEQGHRVVLFEDLEGNFVDVRAVLRAQACGFHAPRAKTR